MDGPNNRNFFNKMRAGDAMVFTEGKQVVAIGKISLKLTSSKLSQELWPDAKGRVFRLIYLIEKIEKAKAPVKAVFSAFGYSPNYIIHGLTAVSTDRLKAFYKDYTSIRALVNDTQACTLCGQVFSWSKYARSDKQKECESCDECWAQEFKIAFFSREDLEDSFEGKEIAKLDDDTLKDVAVRMEIRHCKNDYFQQFLEDIIRDALIDIDSGLDLGKEETDEKANKDR